jgi:hypothetical protein
MITDLAQGKVGLADGSGSHLRIVGPHASTQPRVLIVAVKWWPASARMATALHRHGCRVEAVCPDRHPLTQVSVLERVYRYAGTSSLSSLRNALYESQPELIVPCDDGSVLQLHALHSAEPPLRALIERSLGPPGSYATLESRYEFLEMARQLGIDVPHTRPVHTVDDLADWHDDMGDAAVIKVDGESGGNGVRMTNSFEESVLAWQKLREPCSTASALKRLVIDRDPLALWFRNRVWATTVQELISGRPANSMFACWRGELLAIVSVIVVAAVGLTGAALVIRVIQDERLRKTAKLIAARLKLSGFYGLDFVIEADTGVPYLIEMNPRCTQIGHIEFPGTGSVAGALCAVLRGDPSPIAAMALPPGDQVALFPQAQAVGPAFREMIEASFHDVPYDEPRLARELMLKSWPQRRLLARLYHAFKPPIKTDPYVYEEFATADAVVPAAAKPAGP